MFIVDNSAPDYSNIIESPTDPATYSPGQTYTLNITWTDESIDDVWLVFDGVTYDVIQNGNVYSWSTSNLVVNSYDYTWYANDTIGNENNTGTLSYIVSQASSTLTLTSSPSWTETYGTQTTVNCSADNSEITPQLFRDGVQMSIPDINTLTATTYDYICNASATQNYSAPTQQQNTLTINNITSTCTLSFDKVSPQTYGTQINASCGCTNQETNAVLYRNGMDVTSAENNQLVTLGVDTYNYVCNVSATQNYTSAQDTDSFTINKASTATNLYLNGGQNNKSITYGIQSNATAITNNLSVTLYRDGQVVSNPEIATLGAGTYNYTAINSGDENYTGSSVTWFLIVNKAASSVNLLLDGSDSNITIEVGSTV